MPSHPSPPLAAIVDVLPLREGMRVLDVDGGPVAPPHRILLSWSSGKDCAWALAVLREEPGVEVVALLTTVDAAQERVAMHGTRREILEAQARAAGLPLHVVPLPWPCPNHEYESRMARALEEASGRGVTHIAFGDLFLEDVRAYREELLTGSGITPLFPLWGADTATLARQMVDAGVEAILTCIDPTKVPPSFAGRRFDHAFLDALPPGVDPCGENGEFHTCVVAGPMFREAVRVVTPGGGAGQEQEHGRGLGQDHGRGHERGHEPTTRGERIGHGAGMDGSVPVGVVERDGFLFAEVVLEG